MKLIVLACDRIPLRMLGCYGGEAVETPHLDRLATASTTFDRCYAAAISTPDIQTAWTARILNRLAGENCSIGYFSDRESIPDSLDQRIEQFQFEAQRLPTLSTRQGDFVDPNCCMPAENHPLCQQWLDRHRYRASLKEGTPTSIEMVFAAALEWLDSAGDDYVLWLDLALAEAPWIPPSSYHIQTDATDAANGNTSPLFDPFPGQTGVEYSTEDAERIAAGWASRVAFFDVLVGGFLQGLQEARASDATVIMFASSGEPLAETGFIGPHPDAVFADRMCTPLLICQPNHPRLIRRSAFVTIEDVAEFLMVLHDQTRMQENAISISLHGNDRERWYLPIRIGNVVGIETRNWKLLRRSDRELSLFAKPEDLWDANDVATRYPAICETLAECLDIISKTTNECE